ncbi:MAG: MBL fold metallo-hydrolase, partial [Bacilli bacterium]
MNYNIIATGSRGNAVVIEEDILIDCGVSFRKLKDYYKQFKIVLLTHIHADHFNKTTIKTLAKERPALRFGCC